MSQYHHPGAYQQQGYDNPPLPLHPPELEHGGPSTSAGGRNKRKAATNDDEDDEDSKPVAGAKEGKGGASEFVKKLYR